MSIILAQPLEITTLAFVATRKLDNVKTRAEALAILRALPAPVIRRLAANHWLLIETTTEGQIEALADTFVGP